MDANLTTLNIVTIVTTSILALAAILTYLVQRARYLIEIEPNLELSLPSEIRIDKFGETLQDSWDFFIDIIVKNHSKCHAYDIRYEVKLYISPIRGRPDVIILKIRDLVPPATHPTELLGEQEKIIPIYCGDNATQDLKYELDRYIDIPKTELLGFEAIVKLTYYSRRELVLFSLIPIWNWGRVKYIRKIEHRWKLERNPINSSKFVAVPWKFYEDI